MINLLEKIFTLLALGSPLYLILRWRFKGALGGVVWFWFVIMLMGFTFKRLDPSRDIGEFSTLWVFLGLAGGIIYCIPLYIFIEFLRGWFNKRIL